jgi:Family of unknown function (DUF6326)
MKIKNNGILEDVKINIKIKLSALWITIMVLYIYNDFFSLFSPGVIDEMIAGNMGPFPVTQMSLLSASILMAIPSFMILLSLILRSKINRILNIIIGILYAIVGILNLVGETWVYYITSGVVTIVLSLLVIFLAWNWPEQEV